MSKKKIICIFKNHLRFLSKTETRRIYDIASDFEVFLLVPKGAFIEEKIKEKVKMIKYVPLIKEKNPMLKLINVFILLMFTIKYIKKKKINIIYTPPNLMIFIGFISKKLFNIKWIVDLYDPPISAIKRKSFEKMISYTIKSIENSLLLIFSSLLVFSGLYILLSKHAPREYVLLLFGLLGFVYLVAQRISIRVK